MMLVAAEKRSQRHAIQRTVMNMIKEHDLVDSVASIRQRFLIDTEREVKPWEVKAVLKKDLFMSYWKVYQSCHSHQLRPQSNPTVAYRLQIILVGLPGKDTDGYGRDLARDDQI